MTALCFWHVPGVMHFVDVGPDGLIKRRVYEAVLPVLVILSACATMAGMHTEPIDAGVAKVYATNLTTAIDATRRALAGAALVLEEIEQPDSTTWVFYAKRPSGQFTAGELVRVVVQGSADEVTIRVLSKRRSAMNVTAKGDWSDVLFTQLALDLTEKQRPSF